VIKKGTKIAEPKANWGFDSWMGLWPRHSSPAWEAIRNNICRPIGSLTQMGTIRLGKRTGEELLN